MSREQNPKNVVAGTTPGAVSSRKITRRGTGSTILAFKNQKIKSKVLGLFFCVSRSHTELDLPFTEVYRYV